jgi:hypothetical protein
MRLAFLALSLLVLAAGCTNVASTTPAKPIVTGKLESVTLWKAPMSATSNEGFSPEKDSRVEVYERFILVTTPGGISHLSQHGSYSGLAFRKD